MSTSDPDLEDRLTTLRPPPPRAGLRDEVLSTLRAELVADARPSLLDRLLARRSTWAAAAALLVALLTASFLSDRAHERRLEALAARPTEAARAPAPPHLRAWQERDALIARLLDQGGHDE